MLLTSLAGTPSIALLLRNPAHAYVLLASCHGPCLGCSVGNTVAGFTTSSLGSGFGTESRKSNQNGAKTEKATAYLLMPHGVAIRSPGNLAAWKAHKPVSWHRARGCHAWKHVPPWRWCSNHRGRARRANAMDAQHGKAARLACKFSSNLASEAPRPLARPWVPRVARTEKQTRWGRHA